MMRCRSPDQHMDYCCTYNGAKAWREKQIAEKEKENEKSHGLVEAIRELTV